MQHPTDLLEAYTLRLLSPETAQRVAEHLAECPICREEVIAQQNLLPLLAYVAPPRQPPAELEERVMAAIAALHPAPRAVKTPSPIVPRAASRNKIVPLVGILSAVGAIAAVLVIMLTVWHSANSTTLSLRDRLTQQARAALHARQATVEYLTATSEGPQNAIAVLVFDPATNRAVLMVGNVPSISKDQAYEFWLVHESANKEILTTPVGVFTLAADGTGELDFQAPIPLSQVQNAGISLERAGGVSVPDSPMLMLLHP